MDSRTLSLIQSIEGYLEHPPPGVPEQLLAEIKNTKEMIEAPRYGPESPGEREAREVAKEAMPQDVYDKYYPSEGVDETQQVGV